VWEGKLAFGWRGLWILLSIHSSSKGHKNEKVGKACLVQKDVILFLNALLPSFHGAPPHAYLQSASHPSAFLRLCLSQSSEFIIWSSVNQ